jgi:dienelactone hydrolase
MNASSSSAIRTTRPVRVSVGARTTLPGDLGVPVRPRGLVIFANAGGDSRFSPRNRFLADVFDHCELATLLIALLTDDEEGIDARTGRLRFDMALLAERILAICAWAERVPQICDLAVGLFGVDTGTGAALVATTQQARGLRAIASQSGRPDLAGSALGRVMAPALFIVGAQDGELIDINRRAIAQMHNDARLEIVPGATRLFDEAGTLDRVAKISADWLTECLR